MLLNMVKYPKSMLDGFLFEVSKKEDKDKFNIILAMTCLDECIDAHPEVSEMLDTNSNALLKKFFKIGREAGKNYLKRKCKICKKEEATYIVNNLSFGKIKLCARCYVSVLERALYESRSLRKAIKLVKRKGGLKWFER